MQSIVILEAPSSASTPWSFRSRSNGSGCSAGVVVALRKRAGVHMSFSSHLSPLLLTPFRSASLCPSGRANSFIKHKDLRSESSSTCQSQSSANKSTSHPTTNNTRGKGKILTADSYSYPPSTTPARASSPSHPGYTRPPPPSAQTSASTSPSRSDSSRSRCQLPLVQDWDC